MTYMVSWTLAAERELANIWNQATDRQAVSDAADFLESELRKCAHDLGESQPNEDVRIAFARPLGIRFRVYELDCCVRVVAVWRIDRKRRS